MDDADEITRRYRAFLARIARHPFTDPEMRAWALAEIEKIYQAERRRLDPKVAGSNGGSDVEPFPDPTLTD